MSHHHLTLQDLTVSYGRVPAIHHINLDLCCGHRVGLLGPNGAGKTTLIKAVAGLVTPEAGRILLHGHNAKSFHQGIAYLPQRGLIDWDFPITVRGMVEMGRFPMLGGWKPFSAADRTAVDEALTVARLTDLADRQINALSGGQQQRAFLARAYAQQAHVYLLDEPFNGLDTNAQADLREILHSMAKAGKLLLVSHHDLKSVPNLFDEVVLLNGELVAHGKTAEVFTPENIARTFSTQIFTGAHR
jgi:ABC-type Mn2+/Zn2+ transport system ATPase subunit